MPLLFSPSAPLVREQCQNTVQTLVIDIDGFVIKNAKIEEAILALLNKPRVIRTQKLQNV
jgi:hypothetical protein